MVRFVVLAVIAAVLIWLFSSRKSSINRLLPPLALGLALIYLIAPIDLIPDTGLVGILDDVAMLAAAAMWVRRQARAPRPSTNDPPHHEEPRSDLDPHEVLGIARDASPQEITRAYREKMKLYHPDRVNGLGEEFQEIANRKTLEIQRAYEALRAARN